jgi:hypothetical protein
MLELIIVILILLWLFGYFGRGRLLTGSLASGNAIHTLLVIVIILVILKLLNIL